MSVHRPARAMTLLEMAGALVVTGVVAVAVLPVVLATMDAFSDSTSQRRAVEGVAYATDRAVRMLREGPRSEGGGVDLVIAAPDHIEFSDGAGLRLTDGVLWQLVPGGEVAVLCRDVDVFELRYLGADGVTDTAGSPVQTRRVELRLGAQGMEFAAAAFVRGTVGSD